MPFVALLDACVLFPAGIRDTLLSVAETELYRVRWTEEILSETRRAILRELPDLDPARIDGMLADMREAFPDATVEGYEQLIGSMTNDEGDRHVLAAAVESDAQVIVTSNLRHFPPEACEPHHIDVQDPDEFLDYAFELDPERVIAAIAYQAAKRQRPVTSFGELLDILADRGLPAFTTSIRTHLSQVDAREAWIQELDLDGVNIGTDLQA